MAVRIFERVSRFLLRSTRFNSIRFFALLILGMLVWSSALQSVCFHRVGFTFGNLR